MRSGSGCTSASKWFVLGTEPLLEAAPDDVMPIRLRRPTHGLRIAYDPRLSADDQAFEFYLQGLAPGDVVHWTIGGETLASAGGKLVWKLRKGDHRVSASVWRRDQAIAGVGEISFSVK